MTQRRPEDPRGEEHPVLVFILVAVVLMGSLILASRIVSGEEATPRDPEASSSQGGAAVVSATATPRAAPPASYIRPLTPPPAVSAASYAVVERGCGALIYGRNEHQRLPPASLTKIVTALVVEDQHTRLDDVVEATVSAKQMVKNGSSVMGIEPHMRLSVNDLLYGLFLPSGNDAALTLAQYVGGGDVSRFVDLMNRESARVGMTDTHFTNPHGLDSAGLYSSAFDMAMAGRALLADPTLARISATPDYSPDWPGPPLQNGNKLLDLYTGAYGVKIGFTDNAHQTIVAAAKRNDRDIIVSLFGSDDRYADAVALFDWAFASTTPPCPPQPAP